MASIFPPQSQDGNASLRFEPRSKSKDRLVERMIAAGSMAENGSILGGLSGMIPNDFRDLYLRYLNSLKFVHRHSKEPAGSEWHHFKHVAAVHLQISTG
jgi:hypothetical protein